MQPASHYYRLSTLQMLRGIVRCLVLAENPFEVIPCGPSLIYSGDNSPVEGPEIRMFRLRAV